MWKTGQLEKDHHPSLQPLHWCNVTVMSMIAQFHPITLQFPYVWNFDCCAYWYIINTHTHTHTAYLERTWVSKEVLHSFLEKYLPVASTSFLVFCQDLRKKYLPAKQEDPATESAVMESEGSGVTWQIFCMWMNWKRLWLEPFFEERKRLQWFLTTKGLRPQKTKSYGIWTARAVVNLIVNLSKKQLPWWRTKADEGLLRRID